MDLKRFFDIANTVNNAGIKTVVFDCKEDGVLVRGADDKTTAAVFSFINGNFIQNTMGVHRLQTMIDRLKLFDLEKATGEVELRGDVARSLTIRQGRKRASISFADPNKMVAPKSIINDELSNRIVMDAEKVAEINSAISALQPELLTLRGDGENIILELLEKDTNDVFSDVVGQNNAGSWERHWSVVPFRRLVTQAIKTAETVEIGIGTKGLMALSVNDVEFVLFPQIPK